MRGLLVAVVGILVLTFGLALALRHLFEVQPGRREAMITGTNPACAKPETDAKRTSSPAPTCADKPPAQH